MGSFRGKTFKEGGGGATAFNVWQRKSKNAVLEIPGKDGDVIQSFGRKSDTLSLLVTVTASQLADLYGQVDRSGSLVYHYDTRTAYLESIDGHEILTADLYVVTLNLLG